MLKYNRYNMCIVGQENCAMLEKNATYYYMCSAIHFQEIKQLAHLLNSLRMSYFQRIAVLVLV